MITERDAKEEIANERPLHVEKVYDFDIQLHRIITNLCRLQLRIKNWMVFALNKMVPQATWHGRYWFYCMKNVHKEDVHNRALQPLSQDYNLVSHTTYVVCVNFIQEWQLLQYRTISGQFELPSEFLHRNLLSGSHRLRYLIWHLNRSLSSNKSYATIFENTCQYLDLSIEYT